MEYTFQNPGTVDRMLRHTVFYCIRTGSGKHTGHIRKVLLFVPMQEGGKARLLRDRCHQQQWDEETAWALRKLDYTWTLPGKPGP